MPRRNHKGRRRAAPRPMPVQEGKEPSYDEIAARLVREGKVSFAVLDNPAQLRRKS